MKPQIIENYLGEFRMGTNGFGITIINKDVTINVFDKEIIFASAEKKINIENYIDYSNDSKYLIIEGAFFTYIIDLIDNTISIYQCTIKDANGAWSEEIPIMGNNKTHINTKKRHYYIQYPFFTQSEFTNKWNYYKWKRLEQINEMINGS